MLSMDKCREILGDNSPFSDEELERLRGTLYSVVEGVVDLYFRTADSSVHDPQDETEAGQDE